MARCGVSTLLLEKNHQIAIGRADGLEPRSLEILESFGVIHEVWPHTNRTVECCIWNTDEAGKIHRRLRKRNFSPELSRYQEATLEQARIEQAMLDNVKRYGCLEFVNGATATNMKILNKGRNTSHPIEIEFQGPQEECLGTSDCESPRVLRKVSTQYLVGCDGAHSWTRDQIGAQLIQERTGQLWGVVDFIPKTNFPDVRSRCIVTSKLGTMMVIPREDNMVRFYVPLSALAIRRSAVGPNVIFQAARSILYPYELEYCNLRWWSTYEVARGITTEYSHLNRVFLAGDAAHVHSPKAGQGMNVSLQDSFNLGWKLASVIHGHAGPKLLATYERERRPVAERLMELDVQFNKLFSKRDDGQGDTVRAIVAGLNQEHNDSAPIAASYFSAMRASLESHDMPELPKTSGVAAHVEIGKRVLDAAVVRHADARPLPILTMLPSDGRWRVIVFGGDISEEEKMKSLHSTAKQLDGLCSQWGSLLDPILIHCSSRDDVELISMPPIFLPQLPGMGYNYDKVFVDEHSLDAETGSTYKRFGIESEGALVLVRPDQVVAWTGGLQQVDVLASFLNASLYRTA